MGNLSVEVSSSVKQTDPVATANSAVLKPLYFRDEGLIVELLLTVNGVNAGSRYLTVSTLNEAE